MLDIVKWKRILDIMRYWGILVGNIQKLNYLIDKTPFLLLLESNCEVCFVMIMEGTSSRGTRRRHCTIGQIWGEKSSL